jgi:hypothetical protein
MGDAKPRRRTFEEIKRGCVPGLVEVLHTEGLEAIRYALLDGTGWHHNYDQCLLRHRATEEQKRVGWETWVRIEKLIGAVLREVHERQIEETMDGLSERPEGPYKRPSRSRTPEVTPGTPGEEYHKPGALGTGGNSGAQRRFGRQSLGEPCRTPP